MMRLSIKPVLAAAVLGVLGGCATTMEVGPGYYRYDTGVAYTAPATTTVTTPPAVVYREPTVVYREPTLVYREPTVVERRTIIERTP